MKTVINLLEKKNNYLSQFEQLSSFEWKRICGGDFSNIESFYYSRQIILDAIDRIDYKLKKYKLSLSDKDIQKKIMPLLQKKHKIIMSILHKDLLIHSNIRDLESGLLENRIAG